MKKIFFHKKKVILRAAKSTFWFLVGAILGLFFLISFLFIFFQRSYYHRVFPGVMVYGIPLGGKSRDEVKTYFDNKNKSFAKTKFVFTINDTPIGTLSAQELHLGYNEDLLADQAYSVGRSQDVVANTSLVIQAYFYGANLPPSYQYLDNTLDTFIKPTADSVKVEPIEALFTFENGRVVTFQPSSNGQEVDIPTLKKRIASYLPSVIAAETNQTIVVPIPIKKIEPKLTTEKVNNMGIKELLASGTSLFQGSIESRIYNVSLGASRVNGVLVKPGDVFSFNEALGDVSAFTGYKQAYVIQNGRTVLGDGGGICQVSTTLFRAILNAGLPIVERHAHAYRVHYYEEDSPPGIDATIYVPGVDLKFKNDTDHYILIQNFVDPVNLRLTFMLYGTKDDRQVTIGEPVILSQTPPPTPLYQDDPSLPKGAVKQVDWEAWGANIYFTRDIVKNGVKLPTEKFVSNFRPWQAVYVRGTKE